jgi:hypothetical protein
MNPLVTIPAETLTACRDIHAADLAFQAYLAAGQNTENTHNALIEALVLDPSTVNQTALHEFLAALPARQALQRMIIAGQLRERHIRGKQLAAVLAEPLSAGIAEIEDELATSLAADAVVAADLGVSFIQSALSTSLAERLGISKHYLANVTRFEASAAKTLSRLGYQCGDLPPTQLEALAWWRSMANTRQNVTGEPV